MTHDESNHPIWHRSDVVKHYERNFIKIFPSEKELFDKYLTASMRVLDLACGAGRVSSYLRDRVVYIKGIDISPGMVEAYKKNVSGVDVECRSLLELDEPDAAYDAVLIPYNSFDYVLPEEARADVLRKIYRALRPNGVFIFSGHNTSGGVGIVLYALRPKAFLMEFSRFMRGEYFKQKAISTSAMWGEQPKHFRATPEYIINEISSYDFEFLEMRGGNLNGGSKAMNKLLETWIYYAFRKAAA